MEKKPFIIKKLEAFLEQLLFFLGIFIHLIASAVIFSPLLYALYLILAKGNWRSALAVFIAYTVLAIVICLGYEKYKDYKVTKVLNKTWPDFEEDDEED